MIPFVTPAPHPHPLTHSYVHAYAKSVALLYSSILFKISASLKRKYSYKKKTNQHFPIQTENQRTSSPALIALPPQPGNKTLSPALTDVGTTRPSLSGAPGPTAITVASGSGLDVAEVGRNIPDEVFCIELIHSFIGTAEGRNEEKPTVSGLKRWTRTRSKRGTRDLIDLNVAWAAEAFFFKSKKVRN
jgi:hypothetical protein